MIFQCNFIINTYISINYIFDEVNYDKKNK